MHIKDCAQIKCTIHLWANPKAIEGSFSISFLRFAKEDFEITLNKYCGKLSANTQNWSTYYNFLKQNHINGLEKIELDWKFWIKMGIVKFIQHFEEFFKYYYNYYNK